jgi:hypothetical protein
MTRKKMEIVLTWMYLWRRDVLMKKKCGNNLYTDGSYLDHVDKMEEGTA